MKQKKTNEVFDASFRIIGDDLNPDQITSQLGLKPDYSHKKGDANNRSSKSGKIIVGPTHKTGIWSLNSNLPETSTLEEHIASLLERLEPAQDMIKNISLQGYRVDIYCGYFFEHETQGGFDIGPGILQRMGRMGINLAVSTFEM